MWRSGDEFYRAILGSIFILLSIGGIAGAASEMRRQGHFLAGVGIADCTGPVADVSMVRSYVIPIV